MSIINYSGIKKSPMTLFIIGLSGHDSCCTIKHIKTNFLKLSTTEPSVTSLNATGTALGSSTNISSFNAFSLNYKIFLIHPSGASTSPNWIPVNVS